MPACYELIESDYHQELLILRDEELDVIRERKLARSGREWHQVVVVHEVIATHSDQYKRLVHQPLGSSRSDQSAHTSLILLEVLELPEHPYDVHLHGY